MKLSTPVQIADAVASGMGVTIASPWAGPATVIGVSADGHPIARFADGTCEALSGNHPAIAAAPAAEYPDYVHADIPAARGPAPLQQAAAKLLALAGAGVISQKTVLGELGLDRDEFLRQWLNEPQPVPNGEQQAAHWKALEALRQLGRRRDSERSSAARAQFAELVRSRAESQPAPPPGDQPSATPTPVTVLPMPAKNRRRTVTIQP